MPRVRMLSDWGSTLRKRRLRVPKNSTHALGSDGWSTGRFGRGADVSSQLVHRVWKAATVDLGVSSRGTTLCPAPPKGRVTKEKLEVVLCVGCLVMTKRASRKAVAPPFGEPSTLSDVPASRGLCLQNQFASREPK